MSTKTLLEKIDIKLIESSYNEDTGTTSVTITSDIFKRSERHHITCYAKAHKDDYDFRTEITGDTIAFEKAKIVLLKRVKDLFENNSKELVFGEINRVELMAGLPFLIKVTEDQLADYIKQKDVMFKTIKSNREGGSYSGIRVFSVNDEGTEVSEITGGEVNG